MCTTLISESFLLQCLFPNLRAVDCRTCWCSMSESVIDPYLLGTVFAPKGERNWSTCSKEFEECWGEGVVEELVIFDGRV
jgi:hypothetical protein